MNTLEQGLLALQQQDVQQARKLLLTFAMQYPENIEVWAALAQCAVSTAEKKAFLIRLINLNPDYFQKNTTDILFGYLLDKINSFNQELQVIKQKLNVEKTIVQENIQDNSTDNTSLTHWLQNFNITLKTLPQPKEYDAIFNQLANFLGDRYLILAKFYEVLKRHISMHKKLTFRLNKQEDNKEIAIVTQFCTLLYKYALLKTYHYDKTNKIIYAMPSDLGHIKNFLTGGWLERYCYKQIKKHLHQHKIAYEIFTNIEIVLKNKEEFELDIVVFAAEKVLWIECKTKDYQAYIAKYSQMRNLFSLDKQDVILIIPELEPESAQELSALFNITLANQQNFLDFIIK